MTQSQGFEPESERVTRLLRNQIIDGERQPGSKLVERELAAELGVSRLPVREALQVLVAEGLVTPRPRTWAVVRTFTSSDVADLHEVRLAFETMAFRLAAERHTREGLGRLKANLDAQIEAAHAGDDVRAHRAGADFHETVVALAGNDLLVEIERLLGSRMRWLLGQHDDPLAVASEHEALYRAIAMRDARRAEQLAAEHVEQSRVTALEHMGVAAGVDAQGD